MATVLIVWELGSGLGHVLPLRALADRLQEGGHEVIVAARDLLLLRRAFSTAPYALFCVPFFPGLMLPSKQLNALSDVVWFESGGHSREAVQAQFDVWNRLLEKIRPDLIVADAAPMALAATQGLLPRLGYDGYFHATDAAAWTTFRDWERIDATATAQRAEMLLDHINSARIGCGRTAVTDLAAAFGAERQLLRCLPEIDPFGPRATAVCIGQQAVGGVEPLWPDIAGARRVFVYLRSDYAHAERLLGALVRQTDIAVLCVVEAQDVSKLPRATHIAYGSVPVDLQRALADAELVICHGGALHGLATQFGKPTLLMPLHTEHFLTARQAERIGTSLVVMPPLTAADFLTPLRRLLADEGFAHKARAVAAAHRQRTPDAMAVVMAEVQDLLNHRALP
jgi:UDP-N-acetylglucosamine:LPS N-acetylglucosamine transferase